MPRRLTKLRISEVSLVPEGANDGAKVMIYKMHDATSHRETLRKWFGSVDYSKLKIAPPVDDDDDENTQLADDGEATLSPKLEEEEFILALQTANPTLTREQAMYFLLHHASGRSLAQHLSETTKRKETPMTTRADAMREMRNFAKQGMLAIAKHIVERGETTFSEFEFSSCLMEFAKASKLAGESDASAFSRVFSAPTPEGITLRKAHQIAKNTPAAPVAVEPVQVDSEVSGTDSAAAYEKLQKMAADLQRSSPGLSEAQAFSKVFQDPANASMAEAAHRRPSATTNYQFPR